MSNNTDQDDEESSESIHNIDYSNYKFSANLSENLVKQLDLTNTKKYKSETKFDQKNKWIPPSNPGLSNSNQIIPYYYFVSKTRYDSFDYLNIIKDDIRNMRKLNEYQLEYIKKLNNSDKDELIELFNQVIGTIGDIL
jgi:hypothetical protein